MQGLPGGKKKRPDGELNGGEPAASSTRSTAATGTSSTAGLAVGSVLLASADDDPLPPPPPAGSNSGDGPPLPPPPSNDNPLPVPGELPPPPGGADSASGGDGPLPPPPTGVDPSAADGSEPIDDETVDLPLFGRVNADDVGMPLFTIAIGLVDGFNPCAMWVLLFLLSLLVNLKSRWKMFAIAGIFVLISGLAYFAFMAAWLNVFLFIGYLRTVQVVLGVLAIVVGSIHVKDFFAFKQGVSLSIPESAKPGIYARMRRIVNADTMWAAMLGATVLAVLVNVIELLCTAGLPALYTNVLTMQGYPAWKNYAYLALYNVAYMFDDGVMVGVAVATLGNHRLQERQGRWLKLVSGLLVLGLGVVMIVAPEWLV